MQNKSKTSYQIGLYAELLSLLMLLVKGYLPIKWRFKTHCGEIDLIVKRGCTLVFVEVKKRRDQLSAGEAVSLKNQHRVRNCAQVFLLQHREYENFNLRFDAMLVDNFSLWPKHVKNAWN